MLLYRHELDDLSTVMERELENKNQYLVTDSFPSVSTSDFYFFNDGATANQFAADNSSDRDHLSVFNIKDLSELVDIGIKNYWRLPDVIQTEYLITLKTEAMEENKVQDAQTAEKSLQNLQMDVRYAGFGDKLNVQIAEQVTQGKKDFILKDEAKIGDDKMSYFLHFKQGTENTNKYFFNSYDAVLNKKGTGEDIKQTFYQNQGITAMEAYNLLDGRAVYKTLTKYQKPEEQNKGEEKKAAEKFNAWIKVDFSKMNAKGNNHELAQYVDKWGYDVQKRLDTLPLKENKFNDDQEKVIRDLKKGHVVAVNLDVAGSTGKILLEAHPLKRDFKVYDENKVPQSPEILKEYRAAKFDDMVAMDVANKLDTIAAQKAAKNPEQKEEQKAEKSKAKGRKAA